MEEHEFFRAMELERLDATTAGLWPGIQEGSAAAVSAGVRVSERRSWLLGLDEPTATRTELTGSLGVYACAQSWHAPTCRNRRVSPRCLPHTRPTRAADWRRTVGLDVESEVGRLLRRRADCRGGLT